jgi:excinuclease ABC subunit A
VVEIGPKSGEKGGNIVFKGSVKKLYESKCITGQYLSGNLKIKIPPNRRKSKKNITIIGAEQNNLKKIDVVFPLGMFICITGVSGSGKSSLIMDTLYPAIANKLRHSNHKEGLYEKIEGIENIDNVLQIDQSPIGRSPKSTPATYTKVFDEIRKFYAKLPEARIRGYTPGRFSYNVPLKSNGGRCETCQGYGIIKVEMQFLPDAYVICEDCKGKRYNHETLEVRYKGKNISDILEMTVNDAIELFENIPSISKTLKVLQKVGLGYLKLGQPAPTLSGGEAQRIKLSSELRKRFSGHTLYIFDEPTTGLHVDDVKKLIDILNELVDKNNTVVVIEHNMEIIKSSDWIIDLGPGGGDKGGYMIFEGQPEDLINNNRSYTGKYLKKYLEK